MKQIISSYIPCIQLLESQLLALKEAGTAIQVEIIDYKFPPEENNYGDIYAIKEGVLYLVDDITDPEQLYIIPLCKIIGYKQSLV